MRWTNNKRLAKVGGKLGKVAKIKKSNIKKGAVTSSLKKTLNIKLFDLIVNFIIENGKSKDNYFFEFEFLNFKFITSKAEERFLEIQTIEKNNNSCFEIAKFKSIVIKKMESEKNES